jgi:hypothetical protein
MLIDLDLEGERVVGTEAVIGYLHTGFEKNMEAKTWWKAITYPERIDYVSFQYNELVYVLAVEKLLQLEVPRKATWMRMALGELVRIHLTEALVPLRRRLVPDAPAVEVAQGTLEFGVGVGVDVPILTFADACQLDPVQRRYGGEHADRRRRSEGERL